jgi:hypothetical protein
MKVARVLRNISTWNKKEQISIRWIELTNQDLNMHLNVDIVRAKKEKEKRNGANLELNNPI